MRNFKFTITLGMGILCVVIYLFPVLSDALIYNRIEVSEGKVWLLFSGHFVHYSTSHLLLNIIMLMTFGVLLERQDRHAYIWLIIFTLLLMGLCQWFYLHNMQYYAGLSGLVTAIALSLAIEKIQTDKAARSLWVLMFLAILLKVVFEFFNGTSIFQLDADQSFRLVPEIHFTGVIAACSFAAFRLASRFWRKNNHSQTTSFV